MVIFKILGAGETTILPLYALYTPIPLYDLGENMAIHIIFDMGEGTFTMWADLRENMIMTIMFIAGEVSVAPT